MLTLSEKLALSLPRKNFSPLPHNKQTKKAQKRRRNFELLPVIWCGGIENF